MLPDPEIAALEDALRSAPPGDVLEIGTAAGRTLLRLMATFDDASRPRFSVVDPMTFFPNQRSTVEKNLRDHGFDPSTVRFFETTSDRALAEWPGDELAFVFVDGDHQITGITGDLRWARHVKAGGIVCFHDYARRAIAVPMAVDRFLRKNPHYEKVRLVESVLVVRKTAPSTGPEVSAWDLVRAKLLKPALKLRRSILKRLWPAALK